MSDPRDMPEMQEMSMPMAAPVETDHAAMTNSFITNNAGPPNRLWNVGREVYAPLEPLAQWMTPVQPRRADTGGLAYGLGGRIAPTERVAWQLQPELLKKVMPYTPAATAVASGADILTANITNAGLRIENNYVKPMKGAGVGGSNGEADAYEAPNALSLYQYRYFPSRDAATVGDTSGRVE